jgi:hypothetical protein
LTDLRCQAKQVVAHLRAHHQGEDEAATAAHLVEEHGLRSDRDLRDIVRFARLELQEPVCSTFSGHYCYPTGPGDDVLDHCIKQQKDMGLRYLENARALERAAEKAWPPERLFEVAK